ncbi:MAG: CoA-binding protein [Elusimicrobiota bacterium]
MSGSAHDVETLLKMTTVAVVGCSPDSTHPSHSVAAYLLDAGYRVIPVNPACTEILGEKCYASLLDIPDAVEVVDVFRRPEHAPELARQAVRIGAKGFWLQDGVVSPEAAATARAAGLLVVEDDCIMRQHLSRFGR